MATPIGHALVGAALARRLGMRSPSRQLLAIVAAGLPDLDVPAGVLLHRDPWKLHKKRGGTHTLGFALTAGMAVGALGIVSAGAQGDRDVVADAMSGAALVASHLVLDKLPLPYLKTKKTGGSVPEFALKMAYNLALDALVYGWLASRFWATPEAPAVSS